MNLSSTIKSIQDIMRKDDGVDGDAQRLGQLTWMLFLKVFDQREQEWEDDARAEGKKYKSPLPSELRWRNWAAYVTDADGKKKPQTAASEIIGFVNNQLFPMLKDLSVASNADAKSRARHQVIRSVFEDANNYMKSGTQLLAVIEKLEDAINFDDFTVRANLGDVYEQLLKVQTDSGEQPALMALKHAEKYQLTADDPERAEYFVRVRWLDTVPENKAITEVGLFGNQNTVCQPTTPKWRHTVERLKLAFPGWDMSEI